MATAKKAPGTDIIEMEPSNTAVALPTDFLAELAKHAKEDAASERPSVSKFSTAGGILKYGGDPVAGNNLDVVVLFASHRNVWYAGAYDRDNIENPDCFALSEDGEDMEPHENVANPPSETCSGCPKNQWKSDVKPDGRVGKGKACKESRRVVLMPASALESVEGVKKAELALLDLPVTSAKNFGGLVNSIAATISAPVWAAVTNVKVQPHPKNQFEVIFTPLRLAGGQDIILAIKDRLEDAKRIALEPYDETNPANSAVAAAQKEREAAASKKF